MIKKSLILLATLAAVGTTPASAFTKVYLWWTGSSWAYGINYPTPAATSSSFQDACTRAIGLIPTTDSGEVKAYGSYRVSIPAGTINVRRSNVTLDLNNMDITVNAPGQAGTLINMSNCHNSTLRNLTYRPIGTWSYAHFISNCDQFTMENIRVLASGCGIGVRLQGAMNGSSITDRMVGVTINGTCEFSGMSTDQHAIETMGVDQLRINTTVRGTNTGGCALMLNNTSDASVVGVHSQNAGVGSPLGSLRVANSCGNGIHIGSLYSSGSTRGLHIVDTATPLTNFSLGTTTIVSPRDRGMALFGGNGLSLGASGTCDISGVGFTNAVHLGSSVRNTKFYNARIHDNLGVGIYVEAVATGTYFQNSQSWNNGNMSRKFCPVQEVNSSIDWK